jgi:hypothetical protein
MAVISAGAENAQIRCDSVAHPLEAAGVEFIDENGGGPGVRLRKSNDANLKKK